MKKIKNGANNCFFCDKDADFGYSLSDNSDISLKLCLKHQYLLATQMNRLLETETPYEISQRVKYGFQSPKKV